MKLILALIFPHSEKMSDISVTYIGASWCGPCKKVKPSVINLCKKFCIPLKLIDYDDDLTEDQRNDIEKLPFVLVIQSGYTVARFITKHEEELEKWLMVNVRVNIEDDF
jgi:thiol-disulfide isomerase/thioredoxin